MNSEEFRNVEDTVENYSRMKAYAPNMYREAMWQYRNMARGGDGGPLGFWPEDWPQVAVDNGYQIREPTCRQYNYPDHEDRYFKLVLIGLGEMIP